MNTSSAPVWKCYPTTISLAALTTGAYLLQVLMGGDALLRAAGLIPHLVSDPVTLLSVGEGQVVPAWLTFITYQFLHVGWWHVTTNVAGLWCLGMIAEPVIGSRRFAIAYLASGVVCGISVALLIPSSPKPVGGASGAICGVLGGFLALRWSVPHRWRMPFALVEAAAALGLAVWLVLRTPQPAPDRLGALMWHLIPFLAGWLWVRWGRGRLRGH